MATRFVYNEEMARLLVFAQSCADGARRMPSAPAHTSLVLSLYRAVLTQLLLVADEISFGDAATVLGQECCPLCIIHEACAGCSLDDNPERDCCEEWRECMDAIRVQDRALLITGIIRFIRRVSQAQEDIDNDRSQVAASLHQGSDRTPG